MYRLLRATSNITTHKLFMVADKEPQDKEKPKDEALISHVCGASQSGLSRCQATLGVK